MSNLLQLGGHVQNVPQQFRRNVVDWRVVDIDRHFLPNTTSKLAQSIQTRCTLIQHIERIVLKLVLLHLFLPFGEGFILLEFVLANLIRERIRGQVRDYILVIGAEQCCVHSTKFPGSV